MKKNSLLQRKSRKEPKVMCSDHLERCFLPKPTGMFLFAKLVANLFNQTRKANLNNELDPKQFPKDLNDAYVSKTGDIHWTNTQFLPERYTRIVHRVLNDTTPCESEDAALLLGWLVCAKRPLRWYEIQGGVSIDLSMQTVDFELRKLSVDSKALCGSLVEIHSDGEVDLVHLTARRYVACSSQLPANLH
jgi:hypothetical protein